MDWTINLQKRSWLHPAQKVNSLIFLKGCAFMLGINLFSFSVARNITIYNNPLNWKDKTIISLQLCILEHPLQVQSHGGRWINKLYFSHNFLPSTVTLSLEHVFATENLMALTVSFGRHHLSCTFINFSISFSNSEITVLQGENSRANKARIKAKPQTNLMWYWF